MIKKLEIFSFIFQYQLINPIFGLSSYTLLAWQYKDNYGNGPVFAFTNYGNTVSGIALDSGSRYESMTTMIHKTIGSRMYFDSKIRSPLNQWLHIGFRYSNSSGCLLIYN
jgi:hypothetical protein